MFLLRCFLQLSVDLPEIVEQGEARGRLTGLREGRLTGLHEAKIDAIQNMIDLGLTREQILRKYSPEEYEEALRSMPEKSIVRSTPGTYLKPPV